MIAARAQAQILLGTLVLGAVVEGGDDRIVSGAAVIVRPREVIHQRAREHRVVRERVSPGEQREIVRLTLLVAELSDAVRGVIERCSTVRYLVIVLPQLADEADRILRARLVLQVGESAVPLRPVM